MLSAHLRGSNCGSPSWSGAWPPAVPPTDLLNADPELIAGIAAYRRHPWRRELPDPPVIWREGGSRLLDFGTPEVPGSAPRPAVLFVPSLINRAHILDLTEQRSLMRYLARHAVRPLLLDWGWPGEAEREFSLTDYIAGRLERAIAAVHGPVALAGYCMGGLLALAAALRSAADPAKISGLALLATPWDFHAGGARIGLSMAAALATLEPGFAAGRMMPVDVIQTLFALADWSGADGSGADGGVAPRYRGFARLDPASERACQFVALEDWLNDGVPLPASVARECLGGWYGRNAPARGQWRVAGLAVATSTLRCPALVAVPSRDRVVPPASARALAEALPEARVLEFPAGHIGMVAGGGAEAGLWPELLGWLRGL